MFVKVLIYQGITYSVQRLMGFFLYQVDMAALPVPDGTHHSDAQKNRGKLH